VSAPASKPPKKFDTNLVVIGAGAAGLVTAYVAAAARARVMLVERDRMGGDCLNTGCVPSKAIIRSARIAGYIRRVSEFGLQAGPLTVDFPRVMQRVRDVIARVEPHDSVARYTSLGVDCVAGSARLTSPWTVAVNGRTTKTRSIVIATGGRPVVPPIPGLEDVGYLTSDTVWRLQALPRRLLVLGGGPIGCELAQAFARLGSEVTLVEMADRLLGREDAAVSATLAGRFAAEGIRVLTGRRAARFETTGAGKVAVCSGDDGEQRVGFDEVLVAVGRRANTDGLELGNAGIELDRDGTVPVNEYLQTVRPHILACGDVSGPFQLTHAAGFQGWFCAMNALFGSIRRFRVDYTVMPWAVFTDPEIARVGLTAADAREQGLPHEITEYGIDDLDRAIADGEDHGFVKIVTKKGSDRILGATVVGHNAAELITEYVTAMKHGMGLRKILNTIHIYPTLAEANRYAAGNWQKARLSPLALSIAERFHRWRRG
jgi:pyruvate/2-oxoglutarate dehydrogenase complex dihydrolipoamide dehydrogenase (E3) component